MPGIEFIGGLTNFMHVFVCVSESIQRFFKYPSFRHFVSV
jgi:hypothetical protein